MNDRDRAWQLRQEAKLLNEVANSGFTTSRQKKAMMAQARELKRQAHELETIQRGKHE